MSNQFVRDVQFKNWTTQDFIYKFANQDYTFIAGGVYNVPADIATHFAKHLAIRELHKEGKDTLPEGEMTTYQSNCFPGGSVDKALARTEFERVDIKDESVTEQPSLQENKTDKEAQLETSDDDDDDVTDAKNQAGQTPKFKVNIAKSKDKEYTK